MFLVRLPLSSIRRKKICSLQNRNRLCFARFVSRYSKISLTLQKILEKIEEKMI